MENKVRGVGSIIFKNINNQDKFIKSLKDENIKNIYIRGGCLYFKKLEVNNFFKLERLMRYYEAEYTDHFNLADLNVIPVYSMA